MFFTYIKSDCCQQQIYTLLLSQVGCLSNSESYVEGYTGDPYRPRASPVLAKLYLSSPTSRQVRDYLKSEYTVYPLPRR